MRVYVCVQVCVCLHMCVHARLPDYALFDHRYTMTIIHSIAFFLPILKKKKYSHESPIHGDR